MARKASSKSVDNKNSANLCFAAKLWLSAEYKHVAYECVLTRFASVERKAGQFSPFCGFVGMFLQWGNFTEAHGDKLGDIAIYG